MAKNKSLKGEGYFVDTDNGFIYRIPNGAYANGRTKYKSFSGQTKTEAKRRAEKYLEKRDMSFKLGKNPYLSDYMREWLKSFKRDSDKVRPQTYSRMCTVFRRQICPLIGDYKLKDLTNSVIQTKLVNELLQTTSEQTKKPLSSSTISKAIIHLKDCLKQAVIDGYIEQNPCEGIKLSNNTKKDREKNKRFFNDEEIESFVNEAQKKTVNGFPLYKHGAALVLALYSGLRAGELLSLKKQDVDLKNRVINVDSTSVQYYDTDEDSDSYQTVVSLDEKKTKTENGMRVVPLCDIAYRSAKELVSRCRHSTDYLLNGKDIPVEYRNLLRTYKHICGIVHIDDPNGLHTLRHSWASMMIREKVDVKVVSELLGHGDVKFTYGTYVHTTEEQRKGAMLSLDNHKNGTGNDGIQKIGENEKAILEKMQNLSDEKLAQIMKLLE